MSRKCIVVDLDNTMWGGTLGEDGLAALRLATDGPGAPFRAFQQQLVSLWSRGVLLAVCSKNDEAEALSAIDEHPAMLLRRSHLATHRINWRDKPENIRAIASELNIGLDSIVFLDDSPVERAQVRAALPEVLVPELPRDPAHYRLAVLELGVFDRIADTAEDALRNEMYRTQRTRMAAAVAAPTLEHHLKALELVVVLEEAISSAIPRVSQLTLKTNQMTVTTRRYSESAINALLAAGALILTATVSDRFGSDGLTGLAIVRPAEDCWDIDSLILSCRVMGRGVESALLAEVVDRAGAAGALRVRGTYVRTNRNEPASQIYREHGFDLLSDSDETQIWELALPSAVPVPDWVDVRRPTPPADRGTTRRTVLNHVD